MKIIEINTGEEKLLRIALKALDKDLSFMAGEAKDQKLKSELRDLRYDVKALMDKIKDGQGKIL